MTNKLKTETVQLKLSMQDKEYLKVLSERRQMGMSEYLRELIRQEFSKIQ